MTALIAILSVFIVWNRGLLVAAGSLAAWRIAKSSVNATQVIMQDDTTGQILYSLCTSDATPVFTGNESESFSFNNTALVPKRGTSLTGHGYIDDNDGRLLAYIYYLTSDDKLATGIFACDTETGHYVPAYSPYLFPITAATGIMKPDTGLAVLNLGKEAGYRVYLELKDNTTSVLEYDSGPQQWNFGYNISHDPAKESPLGVGLTDNNKITLVSPRDGNNIETSILSLNGTWTTYSFPTPLNLYQSESDDYFYIPTNKTDPNAFSLDTNSTVKSDALEAWDGKTSNIGVAFDSSGKKTRRVFYIGTDSQIHCHQQKDDFLWNVCGDVQPDQWPTADEPNAQLATTYDWYSDQIWLFYMSQGRLTQAYRKNINSWETPTALPNSVVSKSAHNGGLSIGAKAGIGVGVGVAGLALIALLAYIIVQRRKGKSEKEKAEADAEAVAATNQPPPESWPSPAPAYTSGVPGGGAWIDGKWTPTPEPSKSAVPWTDRSSYHPVPVSPMLSSAGTPQPLHPHVHEMSNDERIHEMPAEQGEHATGR
ncbi:hypothetical protein GGR57DRAFT_342454 [Xylariaceae sp. FL1272]|nr:hypothetical protein GGR57DRAFT_342454 [Xylariaceae sp. FL1272]